jgi:hypothetical protein
MAQKQARLARERQARGGKLPPWKQKDYEANNLELTLTSSQQIALLVDQALQVEGCPAKELGEIGRQARTAMRDFNQSVSAPRNNQAEKEIANCLRAKSNLAYQRALRLCDQLDDRLGFDLWSKETWKKSDTPNAQP